MASTSARADLPGLFASFTAIYRTMSAARRRQFYALLGLMLLGAAAELATIGSVVPFLSLLADPHQLRGFDVPLLRAVSPGDRLSTAALIFAGFAILAGVIRLRLAWSTQDFTHRLGYEMVVAIHRKILRQPYSFHIEQNTSRSLAALAKAEILVFECLLPLMQAIIAFLLAAFIIAALIWIDALMALIAAVTFLTIYGATSVLAGRWLARSSEQISRYFDERMKIVQESLGGIREVIVNDSYETYLRLLDRVQLKLNVARARVAFTASAPRFVIETLGMVIIAAIALVIAQREGGFAAALPVFGAIALGAQRLLPLLQQVYAGSSTALGLRSVLSDVVELLQLPELGPPASDATPLVFERQISLNNVSFAYSTRRMPALRNITLTIPRGSLIAIRGETGSGKSTLADLLMGLLEPDDGSISVDGAELTAENRRAWQQNIAHVPQTIFLADVSIAENIALGAPDREPDMARIIEASSKAQLDHFVRTLPAGYDSIVGERGVRLSGGQLQRLGIARAVYKGSPLLVLDEPTSSLDTETEGALLDVLEGLRAEGRTMIIISHRASTAERCDEVVQLRNGCLVKEPERSLRRKRC